VPCLSVGSSVLVNHSCSNMVKINLAVFAPYVHVQKLLGIAQIPAFLSLHKEFLSFKEFLLVCTQEENIVHIDDDDNTLVFIYKESRV